MPIAFGRTPNASSSKEEEEASLEEEEEGASRSRSGFEDEEEASLATNKKPFSKKSNTTATNSLGSDSNSGSDSDVMLEGNCRFGALNPNVKPMKETPKEKKPISKPAALTVKSSVKQPSESKFKNSKWVKKKAPEEDVVIDDGAVALAVEDSKKSGDEKKLFQRLFSEDDE